MRKREQRLWDSMRKAVGCEARLERVENVVTVGMPDVLACAKGRVTFCELKAVEAYPARESTRVIPVGKGLSRDQMNWHMDWRRWGGKSVIVVRVGADLYAFLGDKADFINDYNRRQFISEAFAHDWVGVTEYFRTHNYEN